MKKMFGKKMILAALIAGLFAGAPLMAQAQGHGPARMYQKGPAMHKAPMKEFNRPMKHFNPPPRAMHKGTGLYGGAPSGLCAAGSDGSGTPAAAASSSSPALRP